MKLIRDLLSISEAAAEGSTKPKAEELEIEHAIDVLKKHCKDTLWMVKDMRPFYRGDKGLLHGSQSGVGVLDTRKTTRKSENTSNYYTVILDNTPSRKYFPKRSKSLICTTSKDTASYYSGVVTCLIPFDDAKVGMVNQEDMWDTKITFVHQFNTKFTSIENLNHFFKKLRLDEDWSSFVDFSEKLKHGDEEAVKNLKYVVERSPAIFGGSILGNISDSEKIDEIIDYLKKHFLEAIDRAYSAEDTGHTTYTGAELPVGITSGKRSEAWIEGDIVLIHPHTFSRIRETMFPDED